MDAFSAEELQKLQDQVVQGIQVGEKRTGSDFPITEEALTQGLRVLPHGEPPRSVPRDETSGSDVFFSDLMKQALQGLPTTEEMNAT
jgi:hypothetical protein